MRLMESQPISPPESKLVKLGWIAALTIVAIFGPEWFAVLMFAVVIGGPSAVRALNRMIGLVDRD